MCDAIGPRMSAYRDSLAWDAGLGVAYAAYAGVLIFVGGLCRGWITGLGRGCAVEFMLSHVPKAGPFDRLRAGYGAPTSTLARTRMRTASHPYGKERPMDGAPTSTLARTRTL
jgi:hypothetical protein